MQISQMQFMSSTSIVEQYLAFFAACGHLELPGSPRRVVALPYEFSAAAVTVRRGVARRGEHNAEALADWLGLDESAVAALAARGVLLSG